MLTSPLQPILRSPLSFPLNRIVSGFFPSRLFASGEQGAWYDPSDRATLFQDSAGTTPVTAVEQPVGLILDKSKGLVLGPELVTNGDFSNGTTGWSATGVAALSVVDGRLRVTTTGDGYGGTSFATTSGKTYAMYVGYSANVSGGNIRIRIGSSLGAFSQINLISPVNGYTIYFVASGSTTWVSLGSAIAAVNDFDNISVRELPGNHAFQATTTSRPVLSARKNFYLSTETLATQNVTTRAAKYIVSFWGTGSITLSGTATGTLTGTGAEDRVYLEFTATAGTLTSTVSGSVLKAQLEEV